MLLKVPPGWDINRGQNFGAMGKQKNSVSTVNNSSSRYTQRTLSVISDNGQLFVGGSATSDIFLYLAAEVSELQADANWRDRLMKVMGKNDKPYFRLMQSQLQTLDL